MLQLDGVSFHYPNNGPAFEFNIKLDSGDAAAIMGPSGSGKSTLFDLISGFQIPSAGSISWNENGFHHLPPGERPLSILFQNNNLFEHLTVAKNLSLAFPKGLIPEDKRAQIDRKLTEVGLEGYQTRTVSTLSGGQQQRVAIARTLIRNKPIILLDEPFTGVDDETKAPLVNMVRDLSARLNFAVLLITHDKEEARSCCDHSYRVEHGGLRRIEL